MKTYPVAAFILGKNKILEKPAATDTDSWQPVPVV